MEESTSEDEDLEESEEDEDISSDDDWRIHDSLYVESDSDDNSLVNDPDENSMNASHFEYDKNGAPVDYVEACQSKVTDIPEVYAAESNVNNEVEISNHERIEQDLLIENMNHDLFHNEFEMDRQEIFEGINLVNIYLHKINTYKTFF